MRSLSALKFLPVILLFSACIGDDIIEDLVPERLIITNTVDTLGIDDTFQFLARFTNNVGQTENRDLDWSSSNTNILTIDADGLATGVTAGEVFVYAEVTTDEQTIIDSVQVVVDMETSEPTTQERSGVIQTTSSYALGGDFIVKEDGNDLLIEVASNYVASTALPGLYVYLTNNPSTTSGALEIGAVEVFNGAHVYRIPNVALFDYDYLLYFCKPFNVKVGDGQIE